MRIFCGSDANCAQYEAAQLAYDARWAGKWTSPSRLMEWIEAYPLEAAFHIIPMLLALACIGGLIFIELRRRREEELDRARALKKMSVVLGAALCWMLMFPAAFSTQPFADEAMRSAEAVDVTIVR